MKTVDQETEDIENFKISLSTSAWEKMKCCGDKVDSALEGTMKMDKPEHLEDSIHMNVSEYGICFETFSLSLKLFLCTHASISIDEDELEAAETRKYGSPLTLSRTNAMLNGELHNELLNRNATEQFPFKDKASRETIMQQIEGLRKKEIYPHPPENCNDVCRRRGNNRFDGILAQGLK